MAGDVLFCRACGKQLKPDAAFCPYCGERVAMPTPADQPPAKEAPTVSSGTRTRVFDPARTPVRASQRLGSSSFASLGVWVVAGVGIVCAAVALVSFLGSLSQAAAELSVYALPQAALGAGIYALVSLALIYLIGSLGTGLLRRHLAGRPLRLGSFVVPLVRAVLVIAIIAAGMILVAPALDDPTLRHPLAGFLLGTSSGAGKGCYLLVTYMWPILSGMLPALAAEAALLMGLRVLVARDQKPSASAAPTAPAPATGASAPRPTDPTK